MRRPQPALTESTRPLPDPREATARLDGGGSAQLVVLGRYRLERRLGAGGFGVVWRAFDERLEREVAVKIVPRDAGGERVEREARAAARLGHPGIVALYELAADERDVYLVSELVRGSTMAELMSAGVLSDRDVARIGAALCDALDHAHARGVIHRDVKPQNVMVVAEPAAGAGFAKLTDFGVAHVASDDRLTRTGDVVGTLAYMAPEQAEGRSVSPASDVYSLALTLYESWTGANPVRAASPAATARRLGSRLPSLGARRRDLPAGLSDAIDDALEPEAELRPPAKELEAALRQAEPLLDDESGLVEPEVRERFGLATRRVRAPGFAAALAARAGAGTAAGLLVLVALTQLGPDPPFSAVGAAAATMVAVALLPRLGWLFAAAGVCGWLASPEADREGTALVLALALAPTPLLLPRAGLLWSLPALAPLLGTVALAPAYVGVAGLAPSALRRAGLACSGFIWLAAAELLSGRDLLFGLPDGVLPRGDWEASIGSATSDALGPLLSSPALAPLVVWVAFAAVLPLVVRGRFLAFDLLGAGVWAAGFAVALAGLGDVLASTTALGQPRGGIAGVVLAAVVAVAATSVASPALGAHAEPATAT